MSDIVVILGLVLFGPGLLTSVGFLVRGRRWRESVPLLEAVIDRAIGIEPPARNRIDRFFTLIQLGAMSFVGLVATGLGVVILFETLGLTE